MTPPDKRTVLKTRLAIGAARIPRAVLFRALPAAVIIAASCGPAAPGEDLTASTIAGFDTTVDTGPATTDGQDVSPEGDNAPGRPVLSVTGTSEPDLALTGQGSAGGEAPESATSISPEPLAGSDGATTVPGAVPTSRRRLVVNGVGDVSLDPSYIPALVDHGYEHALSGMDGLFLEDDLTVINLECPASFAGSRVPKQFNFQCDPVALPTIRAAGVDVANQGNNHSLDFGPTAMLESKANLEAAGIASVGTGRNAAEAGEPAIFDIGGWTIAIVGFGGVVPSPDWLATAETPGMADGDTIDSMKGAVERAAGLADLVIVTIHWGKELQAGPPADDVRRAKAMIDAGADAIFGHHPHRLNALEWYRDRPIAWSLGNFVWPRLSAAGADSAVAQVVFEADGTVRACLLDVTIVSDGHPQLDNPNGRTCSS